MTQNNINREREREREREKESRNNLAAFFMNLQKETSNFVKNDDGRKFEEMIEDSLKDFGFSKLINKNDQILKKIAEKHKETFSLKQVEEKWKLLKKKVTDKISIELIQNDFKNLDSYFIHQPFGKQQYPDFLIFCNDTVFSIELKFSKKDNMPMWNSNLPKSQGVYIFGSANKDLIFFRGEDFLSNETRKVLNNFFISLNQNLLEKQLKEKLSESKNINNPFGMKTYIRKAFDYKTTFRTKDKFEDNNLFNTLRKKEWEENVINFIKGEENE